MASLKGGNHRGKFGWTKNSQPTAVTKKLGK